MLGIESHLIPPRRQVNLKSAKSLLSHQLFIQNVTNWRKKRDDTRHFRTQKYLKSTKRKKSLSLHKRRSLHRRPRKSTKTDVIIPNRLKILQATIQTTETSHFRIRAISSLVKSNLEELVRILYSQRIAGKTLIAPIRICQWPQTPSRKRFKLIRSLNLSIKLKRLWTKSLNLELKLKSKFKSSKRWSKMRRNCFLILDRWSKIDKFN